MKQTPRLEVVPTGTFRVDIIDRIDRQRRMAHAIMLAVVGARAEGNDEGIDDLCVIHITELSRLSAAISGEKQS